MTFASKFRRPAAAIAVLFAVIIIAGVAWRMFDRDPETSAPDVQSTAELVTRGEYLVKAADCAACHTVSGGQPFAGGVAFHLPFGTIYSTNITADAETGIGTWSDDDFVRALHQGVAKDGSHLYPAFPYTSYTALSRDDAVAIKAYLFNLKPVHAPARPNDLGFPYNQRWAMAFWNFAFLDEHRFRADPTLGDAVNRGNYLANALAHCGECHTPRGFAYNLDNARQFAGASIQGWHAYNITSNRNSGIGSWSDRQIADYLSTGHAENHGSAAGPMAEAVENSFRYLSEQDVASIVAYLRTVKPEASASDVVAGPAPTAMASSSSWSAGGNSPDDGNPLGYRIFQGGCASCHGWDGKGQVTPYAALAGSRTVNDPTGENLLQILLNGQKVETAHGTLSMPSFRSAYTDAELAAVVNYVVGHFGGKTGQLTAEEVAKRRLTN